MVGGFVGDFVGGVVGISVGCTSTKEEAYVSMVGRNTKNTKEG